MVRCVQREDVRAGSHQEEPCDAEQQVGRADDHVDGLGRTHTAEACDEERAADEEVRDVVQRVHREDAEQQSALGRDEADARRDCEPQQTDEDVDAAEDGGEKAVR